ncbi:MAG: hypothetical protein ACUVWR_09340 [Anaerolineae bacterium]
MKSWMLRLFAVVLVVSLTVVLILPVAADAPAQGPPASLELKVEESGDWSVILGGEDLGLNSKNIVALSNRFGFGLPPLAIDPSMVKMATDNGIQNFALVKEGNQTTIFINGLPASALAISDDAAKSLAAQFAPELEALLAWVNKTSTSVVIHFPVPAGAQEYPIDLTQKLAAPEVSGATANMIDVSATLSPAGELISVGGLSTDILGLGGMMFDLSWLTQLGLEGVDLTLTPEGVAIASNGAEWATLAVNMDFVKASVPQISQQMGFALGPANQAMVDLAFDWLEDTEVHIGAYVSDTAMDTPPVISLGRPVAIAVTADKELVVEGMNTGFLLDDFTLGYVQQLGSAGIVWDGASGQLRMAMADKPLPAVVADEGFVQTAGAAFLGDYFLPWDKIEQIVANSKFAATLTYADSTPVDIAKLMEPIQVQEPAAPFAADLLVSRADGRVAVLGEAIPIDLVAPGTEDMIKFYVEQLGTGVDSFNLNLGPGGLLFGVNGKNVRLAWDRASRDTVVGMALDISASQFGMPALSSGLVRAGIEFLIGAINQVDLGVSVKFTDETIPPGSLESLVGLFF